MPRISSRPCYLFDALGRHIRGDAEVWRIRGIHRKQIKLQKARLEGIEIGTEKGIEKLEKAARSLLARGMPLQEVAETLDLPADWLQQLQPH